jgi:hypothetical protein
MKIAEIKELIQSYVDEHIINFQIERAIFNEDTGRENFNQTIRNNVENKFGVYFWVDNEKEEVVYIGMAGKIKTNGTLGDHSIQKRLIASRGKSKTTKKDILTNDYVRDFMNNNQIKSLDFYIMYSKKGEPPAFIEALLLYNFYKKNNRLPRLNNSF